MAQTRRKPRPMGGRRSGTPGARRPVRPLRDLTDAALMARLRRLRPERYGDVWPDAD